MRDAEAKCGRGCADGRYQRRSDEVRVWNFTESMLSSRFKFIFSFGVFADGYQFAKEDVEDLERIRDQIQQLSVDAVEKSLTLEVEDTVTLAEYVKNIGARDRTIRMVNVWAQVMLGVEASAVSARYFIDYCAKGGSLMTMRSDSKHGGQYLRFHKGSQAIAKGIAALLPEGSVKLSTPVKKIVDLEGHVQVTSLHGESFTAKKVILSVPTPLYKNFEFSPPLQKEKLKAVESTELGFYTKVILCYDQPWWVDSKLCGLALSFHGPVIVARDTSVPAKRQFSLTCFVNADIGVAWSLLPAHERRARIIDHVWKLYGKSCDGRVSKETVYSPIEVFEMQWTKEEWSEGAVCPVTRPGALNESADWMKKRAGSIHFVGTEFASQWKGYMEGALSSGEEGGLEVVNALNKTARL